MNLSKQALFHWLRIFVAPAIVVSVANLAAAQVYLTIDGRDVANLAGDGNHATFHNPPVNFAFTFGGVTADNPDAGPGDPPTATETDFNFTGNDFGGLGFGTAAAGELAFPAATAIYRVDLTVNSANTLGSLVLNLKDRDPTPPLGSGVEEHQYTLALGAPGTKTLTGLINAPGFTNNAIDGIPNFDPSLGLSELQLQYPFGSGGSGAILDVTIHNIQIREIPEPSSMLTAMVGLGLCTLCGFRRR